MKKFLLLSSLCGLFTHAMAEAYLDLNLGANTSWNTVGLNLDAGYMFNNYIGLEGGFTYSPGYTYKWGHNYSYDTSYWMLDGAVKGVLPLTSIFSLYGKLGLAFNNYSGNWYGCQGYMCGGPGYSGSNVGLLMAGGAQFKLSRQWSLHIEDYASTGPNPNFLMFGGQYNF